MTVVEIVGTSTAAALICLPTYPAIIKGSAMTKYLDSLTRSEAETWEIKATFLDPDGDPLDLTGATIQWVVAASQGAAVALFTAAIGTGVTVIDAPAGRADIKVHPGVAPGHGAVIPRVDADGANLPYFHQCRVVMIDGTAYVQFQGLLEVTQSPFIVP